MPHRPYFSRTGSRAQTNATAINGIMIIQVISVKQLWVSLLASSSETRE